MLFDCIVFIGRFQPFHAAHAAALAEALAKADQIVLILGSAYRARSVANPFTVSERVEMIRAYCQEHHLHDMHRIHYEGVEDRYYHEARWLTDVRTAVKKHCAQSKIGIIGYDKDPTISFLNSFPEYTVVPVPYHPGIHATSIRFQFFSQQLFQTKSVLTFVPPTIQGLLKIFQTRPEYQRLCQSFIAIERYKAEWSVAPYPPILVTADALVVCQAHILLIQRGNEPGRGLLAMPGGFLEPTEWIRQGVIRELLEETQIAVSESLLEQSLQQITVFDYPTRSLVGRVVTHVGLLRLNQTELPSIQGSDDAAGAAWYPLQSLPTLKEQFHDDHYLIINHLLQLE